MVRSSVRTKTSRSIEHQKSSTPMVVIDDHDAKAACLISDGFETASEGEAGGEQADEPGETEQVEKSRYVEEEEEPLNQEAKEAKAVGNKLFVESHFVEALLQYDLALQLIANNVPNSSLQLRSICHSNRATCFYKLGKYEETIKECKKALQLNPNYVKPLIKKADAHEKLDNFEEAILDLNNIIELDPSNSQATITKRRLESLAEAKRDQNMKEEMTGKLRGYSFSYF